MKVVIKRFTIWHAITLVFLNGDKAFSKSSFFTPTLTINSLQNKGDHCLVSLKVLVANYTIDLNESNTKQQLKTL